VTYAEMIDSKRHSRISEGVPMKLKSDLAFDFQSYLVEWSLNRGRSGIFADCGLGKTLMGLMWADNVANHTGKPVLILTPLAVSIQMVPESHKFGIPAVRSQDGTVHRITITNYERLNRFNPTDFGGVICDESSILKSFDGAIRNEVNQFMKRVQYRLLLTATAAPNDYTELGTSSEALGYMGHMDMLARFFKNDQNTNSDRRFFGEAPKWRFKGHAEMKFWEWVASWAKACRKPSDIGFDDGGFKLPPLTVSHYMVDVDTTPPDALFSMPANNLHDQRKEKKRTITERCETAAAIANGHKSPAVVWCQMNDEAALLKALIPDAVEISGSDSDDNKEAKFLQFLSGERKVLITKPKIGAWGLNFQHCHRVVYFPSHSYEQYYQSVRRCLRFGQLSPVEVSLVMTEGEKLIMQNLQKKELKAQAMFNNLVAQMSAADSGERIVSAAKAVEVPAWI